MEEEIVEDISEENFISGWWDNLTPEEFQLTFRLSRQCFVEIQAEIDNAEDVDNPDTDIKLLATLWFLGNTANLEEVDKLFDLENITADIKEYAGKILNLASTYLTWPTDDECRLIENGFASHYGFPGVVGVIGSLYIGIKADKTKLKTEYYNPDTKKHKIVLQIVCDDNLLIRDMAVGFPAGKSVEDILKSTPLYNKLVDIKGYLMKNDKHLLGGYKHPELKTLLTPYRIKNKNDEKEKYKFNALHDSVMLTVERTFRCIELRFPRITALESFPPSFATLLVGAICVLHNFARVKNDSCEEFNNG